MSTEKKLSLEEAARLVGVSPGYMKELVEKGTFRPVEQDSEGNPLFTEESLQRDLEAARERGMRMMDELIALSEELGLYHIPEPRDRQED